jgi:cyclopropane fatty-acyl-phospholipid synthase-like methyltransferase
LEIYEQLYETHARALPDEEVVGRGPFDLIGRIELGLLRMAGLSPGDTLLDLGCGVGRLAVHAIPALGTGHYIGLDISQTMLDRAQQRIGEQIPKPACRISWVRHASSVLPFEDASLDMMCAFSVFTHMEHEDSYRYLKDARRIVRPNGRCVYSCVPITLAVGHELFVAGAGIDFDQRWRSVRTITTSMEFMDEIARLAGWTPLRWYPGDEDTITVEGTDRLWRLGQSACVLT